MFCWNTFLFYYLLHDFCYFNRNIRYFSPPHLDSLSPISLALQVLHLRSICFYERTDINFFPHLTKNVSVYHKAVPSVLFEGQKWKSIARYHGPYSSATTALPSISTLCSACSPCQKERHKNRCPTEPTFVPSSLSCHLTREVRCKFQEKPAFIWVTGGTQLVCILWYLTKHELTLPHIEKLSDHKINPLEASLPSFWSSIKCCLAHLFSENFMLKNHA